PRVTEGETPFADRHGSALDVVPGKRFRSPNYTGDHIAVVYRSTNTRSTEFRRVFSYPRNPRSSSAEEYRALNLPVNRSAVGVRECRDSVADGLDCYGRSR